MDHSGRNFRLKNAQTWNYQVTRSGSSSFVLQSVTRSVYGDDSHKRKQHGGRRDAQNRKTKSGKWNNRLVFRRAFTLREHESHLWCTLSVNKPLKTHPERTQKSSLMPAQCKRTFKNSKKKKKKTSRHALFGLISIINETSFRSYLVIDHIRSTKERNVFHSSLRFCSMGQGVYAPLPDPVSPFPPSTQTHSVTLPPTLRRARQEGWNPRPVWKARMIRKSGTGNQI